MTNHVLLDNVAHKDLTVKQRYSADYGHDVGAILCFSTEWSDLQREYPIMIHKDAAANKYQAIVLLGLSPKENLFLQQEGKGWNARYVPAMFAKGPFLIGYEDQTLSGGEASVPVIHVDLDDPRVNAGDGRSVFMPHGGNTDYLNSVSALLSGVQQGAMVDERMFAVFDELGLIEPLAMDITLLNDEQLRIQGHHTISEKRLSSLNGDELLRLNEAGFLQGAFLIINSLSNVNRLIDLKNAQIACQ